MMPLAEAVETVARRQSRQGSVRVRGLVWQKCRCDAMGLVVSR